MDPDRRDLLLHLDLQAMDPKRVRGTYHTKANGPNSMRPDMLFLHPGAAASYADIAPWFVCSDMFRSPESSLDAVEAGRGALLPGYSRHGFGLAADADIDATCKRLGAHLKLGRDATKAELDREMERAGFYCHRRDHLRKREAYHYNWLGKGTEIAPQFATTYGYGEAQLVRLYDLTPDDDAIQAMLRELHRRDPGTYPDPGPVDGDVGKRTRAAAAAFQAKWHLRANGVLDHRTGRTLALVSAVGVHRAAADARA